MKQYLLFDLDGTLIDSMEGITKAAAYALSKFDIHVENRNTLRPFIGPPLAESFMKYYGFDEDQAREAISYYREYYRPTGIYENELYPRMDRLIRDLDHSGFTLILATNKPTVFAQEILKQHDLLDHFALVSGSGLDGSRSRKEDVIRYAMETLDFAPEEALMIGDKENDVEGAKAVGMECAGVLYGFGSAAELTAAGADYIVSTVEELSRLLWRMEEMKGEKKKMIRFGMIGTSKIAQRFYEANRYSGNFELAAIYSRSMDRAKEFGARNGPGLEYYDDLDEFAASDSFEAVYIASPNSCHHDQTVRMLQAGKHVLCEKPLASNLREAEEMFRIAEEKGLILMEGMCSVYTPGFLDMKKRVKSLGRIRRATLQFCQYSSRYDNFKRGIIENAFNPELSNGALMDIGVYPIACMIRLFGPPDRIKASGLFLDNGVDGEGSILFEYPDMIGEALYSKITNQAVDSQILGEEATMLIRQISTIKDLRIFRGTVNQTVHYDQADNILKYETDHFIRAIRTGKGWKKARKLSLETMKVLDEARAQIGIVFPADRQAEDAEEKEAEKEQIEAQTEARTEEQ